MTKPMDDEAIELAERALRTAPSSKAHDKCSECGKVIGPKDSYIITRVWSQYHPTPWDVVLCSADCEDLHDSMCAGG